MDFRHAFSIALAALGDLRVLISTIVIVLFLVFLGFVEGYTKRPPKPKKKKEPKVEAPKEEAPKDDKAKEEKS